MKNLIAQLAFVAAVGLFATLGASSAEAQTQTATGFVRTVAVDGPNDDLVVTLSASVSGGTAITMCFTTPPSTGPHTYGIYYAGSNASKDSIRESFRAMLMAAILSGRQVTVTTTYTASECNINTITFAS